MSTRDEPWPHGTPSWVDLVVDDVPTATDFYSQLFDWRCEEGPPETGGYTMASLQERPVAGIAAKPADATYPNVWTTYLAVDDLDATVAKVKEHGGRLMMDPMDVMDAGRLAVAFDPTGAVFGMWQAGEHKGAGLVNEPGALIWNECLTRDFDRAKDFYSSVFGYELEDLPDDSVKYATLKTAGAVGDNYGGGIGELPSDLPDDVPAHWMTYFGVADPDQTVAKATELGAEVIRPLEDTPYGRMAALRGPQGEVFSIISTTPPSSSDM